MGKPTAELPEDSPSPGELPEASLIGAVLGGRYRVDAVIGQGGFATVYRGHHLRLDSAVAIKVLRFAADASAEARALIVRRFDEECRVITRLRHEHIVRTLDQGLTEADALEEQTPYLVTELCSEGTLDTLLKPSRGKGFALSIAWPLMKAILEGLAYAHREGVAHRDLKPQNLMLAKDVSGRYTPRLIDFGIAKLFDPADKPGSGATASQVPSVCTPTYAAPEQCVGARTGPWTDVHAVGLIFVEMLTGRFAYPEGDLREIVMAAIDPARPTPKTFGVDVGPFEAIIAKSLALRPKDRYRDAGELFAACLDAAKSLELETIRAPLAPAGGGESDTLPLVRRVQTRAGDLGTAATQPAQNRTLESALTPGAPVPMNAARPVGQSEPAAAPKKSSSLALVMLAVSLLLCAALFLVARRATSSVLRPPTSQILPAVERVKLEALTPELMKAQGKQSGYSLIARHNWGLDMAVHDETGFSASLLLLNGKALHQPVLVAVGRYIAGNPTGNPNLRRIYGVSGDHALVLIAVGQDDDLRRAWNRLTRGIEFEILGDDMGGPNPAKAAADASVTR